MNDLVDGESVLHQLAPVSRRSRANLGNIGVLPPTGRILRLSIECDVCSALSILIS